ncbi:hypothetical protein [Pseudomonas sp. JL2]
MLDLNFPLFHITAASLREAGHIVVNPAEFTLTQALGANACAATSRR